MQSSKGTRARAHPDTAGQTYQRSVAMEVDPDVIDVARVDTVVNGRIQYRQPPTVFAELASLAVDER